MKKRLKLTLSLLFVASLVLVAGCDSGSAPGGTRPEGWTGAPGKPPGLSGAGPAKGAPQVPKDSAAGNAGAQ